MRLPATFQLFRRVSQLVGIKPIQKANPKLDIGIQNENMGSYKQLDFLKAVKPQTVKKVTINDFEDGNMDYGQGTRLIPETKDFWMGDPL
jgi:hypothetical protein